MKKICSILLIVILMITSIPFSGISTYAATDEFAGGSGTESDPYLISTKYHLDNVRNYLDAHFKMIADIEFTDADFAGSGEFYNNGNGWTPIGTQALPFAGYFDGNGYRITKLFINEKTDSKIYLGLFGYISGTILNLGLIDGTIALNYQGNQNDPAIVYVGGISGYCNNGWISNCYNTNQIVTEVFSKYDEPFTNSTEVYIGGIAGYINRCVINGSYNLGTITSTCEAPNFSPSYTGGIVGYSTGDADKPSYIYDCYNAATIHSKADCGTAGGISGSQNGLIETCYNRGNISMIAETADNDMYHASADCAGIVGKNSGIVNQCYNTATIYSKVTPKEMSEGHALAGGISGRNSSKGIIINSFNIGTILSKCSLYDCSYSGGITGINSDGKIDYSYNVGTIKQNDQIRPSQVAGNTNSISGNIQNCYSLSNAQSDFSDPSAYNCSFSQFKEASTFKNFDFNSVWTMHGNSSFSFPELKNNPMVPFEKEVVLIKLKDHPTKVNYCEGESFDSTSITVLACYNNGSSEIITNYSTDEYFLPIVDGQIPTIGTKTIILTYQEKSVSLNIYVKKHEFTNACDTTCNCGYVRTISHNYSKYVYNNDATTSKDGTKTRTCSICKKTETVTAAGTKLKNPFKDVKQDKYYAVSVLWAVGKGVTNGLTATTFGPNNDCTRAQIVTFLWRAAGSPEPKNTTNPFTDVSADKFYYKAVLWAVENGITTGTSATTFSPSNGCTRGQVVTFLWRAKGSEKVSTSNPFTDVTKGFYVNAVAWAVKNNITSGISATQFAPNNTCTRGQIVTFLYRAYK